MNLDTMGMSNVHGLVTGFGVFLSGLTKIKAYLGRSPTMGRLDRIAMTLSRTTRLKHRVAQAMLVFWLFALGAAWANACLLQDRTTHLDPSFAGDAGLSAVSPGPIGSQASHVPVQSAGEGSCLKACDEASQCLVKWQEGLELSDMATLAPFPRPSPESVAALHARQPVRIEGRAHSDLPLRTRYVRLAL